MEHNQKQGITITSNNKLWKGVASCSSEIEKLHRQLKFLELRVKELEDEKRSEQEEFVADRMGDYANLL